MAALIAFEDIVSIFGDVLVTSEEQASLAELSAQAEADWQTRLRLETSLRTRAERVQQLKEAGKFTAAAAVAGAGLKKAHTSVFGKKEVTSEFTTPTKQPTNQETISMSKLDKKRKFDKAKHEVGPMILSDDDSLMDIEDVANSPVHGPPTRENALAIAGAGGPKRMMQGETKIDPIPRSRLHPLDKTVQVRMFAKFTGTFTVPNTGAGAISQQYRLNSIYDIQTAHSYSAINPTLASGPVADTADGSPETPALRTYWMSKYNYWTVRS